MNTTVRNIEQNHPATAQHQAEAIVLSCIDFRLTGAVTDYMEGRGLGGNYDHIALAGGALGAMSQEHPAWAEMFWDHLALAKDLHNVQRLILIDHRDCGACKLFVGPTCADDPDAEATIHKHVMEELADAVRARHPDLTIEILLMNLDGSVLDLSQMA